MNNYQKKCGLNHQEKQSQPQHQTAALISPLFHSSQQMLKEAFAIGETQVY